MITGTLIKDMVQHIIDPGLYLVDVTVSASNRIAVTIDSMKGATIDDCIKVSRAIENQLDRDKEDFELEVSSPGLTEPFKVTQQYLKNIGKDVEVLYRNGVKQKGKLCSFSEGSLLLEIQKKVKTEGKKKPGLVAEQIKIDINEIKATKLVLNF